MAYDIGMEVAFMSKPIKVGDAVQMSMQLQVTHSNRFYRGKRGLVIDDLGDAHWLVLWAGGTRTVEATTNLEPFGLPGVEMTK